MASIPLVVSLPLLSSVYATNIGTGSVTGSSALNTVINWNDTYSSGAASGTIAGLTIKAKIQPTLNMTIAGSGVVDLGTLNAVSYSTGTVNIEVGTNATNGAAVTASSVNGGLRNGGNYINNNILADGIVDSYTFSSVAGTGASDSSFTGITQTYLPASVEIFNSTPQQIYKGDKPQQLNGIDDVVFAIAAKPSAETPAGLYADQVNITITGNF